MQNNGIYQARAGCRTEEPKAEDVNESIYLLKKRESQLSICKGCKTQVFVLGMHDSGKGTLINAITNVEQLVSYEAGGRILIRHCKDSDRGASSFRPKNTSPDPYVDKSTNCAYHHVPLGGTLSPVYEVASVWFLRQIAFHAEQLKILLVVNYSTLQTRESRSNIKYFLELAADLIKFPDKFKTSLALVATKVPTSLSDEHIISRIRKFLQMIRADVPNIFTNIKTKVRALSILDILIPKDQDGNINKIALFRQPNKIGPLKANQEIMRSITNIKSVLFNNLSYSRVSSNELDFSLSAPAKRILSKVAAITSQKISDELQVLGERIKISITQHIRASSGERKQNWIGNINKLKKVVNKVLLAKNPKEVLKIFNSIQEHLRQCGIQMGSFKPLEEQIQMLSHFEVMGGEEVQLPLLDWYMSLLDSLTMSTDRTPLPDPDLSTEDSLIQRTVKLLNEGDRRIQLDSAHKRFCLVIGLTGAGKSTLAISLTNPARLQSYERDGRNLIMDAEGKISVDSTLVSETTLPELFYDGNNEAVFYDFPGFFDTRDSAVEISNAWFMWKVASYAKQVKLIFTVSYSTVRAAENRTDFKNFLELATELVKVPERFKDSIALVATKIDNPNKPGDIIAGMVKYLAATKRDLPKINLEPAKLKKATELIDILLTHDGNKYSRLAFFPLPKSEGSLELISDVMKSLGCIKEMIHENLRYSDSSPADFGIGISAASKLEIANVAEQINNDVALELQGLTRSIASDLIQHVDAEALETTGVFLRLAQQLENLVTLFDQAKTREDYIEFCRKILASFDLPVSYRLTFEAISSKIQMLSYFQGLADESIPVPILEWTNSWTRTCQKFRSAVVEKSIALNNLLTDHALIIAAQTQEIVNMKISAAGKIENQLKEAISIFSYLRNVPDALKNTQTINSYFKCVKSKLVPLLGRLVCDNIIKLQVDIPVQSSNPSQPSAFVPLAWTIPFHDVVTKLESTQKEIEKKILERNNRLKQEKLRREMQDQQEANDLKLTEMEKSRRKAERDKEAKDEENQRLQKEHKENMDRITRDYQRSQQQQSQQIAALQQQIQNVRRPKKKNFFQTFVGAVATFLPLVNLFLD